MRLLNFDFRYIFCRTFLKYSLKIPIKKLLINKDEFKIDYKVKKVKGTQTRSCCKEDRTDGVRFRDYGVNYRN